MVALHVTLNKIEYKQAGILDDVFAWIIIFKMILINVKNVIIVVKPVRNMDMINVKIVIKMVLYASHF